MSNTLNKMKLTIDAKSQNESLVRNTVAGFFAQINPTIEQIEDVKTAVSEAVTNSIVHGYEGKQEGEIVVDCELQPEKLEVSVTDFGKGIKNIEEAMRPFFTTCETGERSGMGFTVMQAFCNKVGVESNGNETKVTLIKYLNED